MDGREIPPPRADRPPLKTNLLNHMQKGNTALTPLFPYMHAGAFVPAGSLFIGGPGTNYGQFYHHNSVDEIIIAFVTQGATLPTGQLYCGGRSHGVNGFMKDQTKQGSFALFAVTQRQLEEGEQPEALVLLCEGCRHEYFRTSWDGASPPEAHELDHPFSGSAALGAPLSRYNEDPALRTCEACGHVHDPFPLDAWGFEAYRRQSEVMGRAKQILHESAQPGEAG